MYVCSVERMAELVYATKEYEALPFTEIETQWSS